LSSDIHNSLDTISAMDPPATPPRPGLLPAAITLGFAIAVGMWMIGFLSHLPGLVLPPAATGSLLMGAQLAGGLVAGRIAPAAPWKLGAAASLIAATLNLLILGALIAPEDPEAGLDVAAPLAAGSYLIASAIAGAIAALIGAATRSTTPTARPATTWLAAFAIVAFISLIPVLFSGGIVTSANAGLAVHDWPGSYNALMWLYPLSRMTGGVYFEHAHRLFGSLAGLTVLALMVFTLLADPRKLARGLAVGAFLLVLAQGVLGGIRVTSADPIDPTRDLRAVTAADVPADAALDHRLTQDNEKSLALAMVHGATGQLTFGYLAAVAVVLSVRFRSPDPPIASPDRLLRIATTALLITLTLQLLLGVMTRHLESFHAMMTHLGFAAFVVVAALAAGARAMKHRAHRQLHHHGTVLTIAVIAQVLLGFIAMMVVLPTYRPDAGPDPNRAIILATAHQFLGGLLLALAAILFTWTRRLVPAR